MNRESEEVLNRLFKSPARRAADPPPRGLSKDLKDGPICDMPDEQRLFALKIVHL